MRFNLFFLHSLSEYLVVFKIVLVLLYKFPLKYGLSAGIYGLSFCTVSLLSVASSGNDSDILRIVE